MNDKRIIKNREGARVVAGLIIIAAGVALLFRNTGYLQLPDWLFSWPMILILVGVYSGVKHNFQNNSWIILMAIGGFFLLERFMPEIHLKPVFWPIIIIGIGILFILRAGKKNDMPKGPNDQLFDKDWNNAATADTSNFIKIDSVFSGVNRKILSKNFQGGKVSCVFGGAAIDLSQADISGNILLKMDAVFGGIKLIVPPNWTLHNEIEGVFHNVEDKRKYNGVITDQGKVLVLKGSAVFGGVEIRSY